MIQTHDASQQVLSSDDWRNVLACRNDARLPGWLIPHAGKSAIVTAASLEPAIDTAALCATAVISTPTPDRSEDIVEPLGVRLENYARNPVVYFDHGLSGLALPIAKSEDPAGSLAVKVTPAGIEATSYFSQSLCEALQVFDLIQQKIIRGTSISMMPLVARIRTVGKNGRPGLHIQEWDLLEWSWVGIPDNPEAVRKVLDAGKLAGSPICEPLRKCLIPFAAQARPLGRGMLVEEEHEPFLGGSAEVAQSNASDASQHAISEDEEPSAQRADAEVPAEARAKSMNLTPGKTETALVKVHQALTRALCALEDDQESSEHPEVAAYCVQLRANVGKALRRLQHSRAVQSGPHPLETEDLNSETGWIVTFNGRLERVEQKMTAAATRLLEAIPYRQS